MRSYYLAPLLLLIALIPIPAFACTCAPPPPPDPNHSSTLSTPPSIETGTTFEGTVTGAHLKWDLVDANVGDLISADLDKDPPYMLVSFDVSRSYSGQQGKKVELRTGLGGGDCGVPFEVGKQYLVYAWKDESGKLSTGICSGTGFLEDRKADLAALRGEPAVSPDADKLALPSTRLCGHVVKSSQANSPENSLLLISAGDKSPVPTDEAEIAADGSFCAKDVAPGEYYLLYVGGTEEIPDSFGFFPGVTKLSDAKTISVGRGQQIENLLLKVPFQPSYSVSGGVTAFDKAYTELQPKVALFNAEYIQVGLIYSQGLSSDGTFEFPHVLPGKYLAIVTVDGDDASKWLTTKVAVDVDNNVSGLSLTLVKK
jgi:hypothetical protein